MRRAQAARSRGHDAGAAAAVPRLRAAARGHAGHGGNIAVPAHGRHPTAPPAGGRSPVLRGGPQPTRTLVVKVFLARWARLWAVGSGTAPTSRSSDPFLLLGFQRVGSEVGRHINQEFGSCVMVPFLPQFLAIPNCRSSNEIVRVGARRIHCPIHLPATRPPTMVVFTTSPVSVKVWAILGSDQPSGF